MVLIRRLLSCVLLVVLAMSAHGRILTPSDTLQLKVDDLDNYITSSFGNLFNPEVIDQGYAVLLKSTRKLCDGIDEIIDEDVVFIRPSDRDVLLSKFGIILAALDLIEHDRLLLALERLRGLIRDVELKRTEDAEFLKLIDEDLNADDVLLWQSQILIVYCDWKLCRQYQTQALAANDMDAAFIAIQYLMRFYGDLLHAFDTNSMAEALNSLSTYFGNPEEADKINALLASSNIYYQDWQLSYFTVAHQVTYNVGNMVPEVTLRILRWLCERWWQADEQYPYPECQLGDLGWLLAQYELVKCELKQNNFHHAYLCAKQLRGEISSRHSKYYATQPFTIYAGCMQVLVSLSTSDNMQAYAEELIDYLLRTNGPVIAIMPFLRMYYGCRYEKDYIGNHDFRWVPLSDPSLIESDSIIRVPSKDMPISRYREMDRGQLKDCILYLSNAITDQIANTVVTQGDKMRSDPYLHFLYQSLLWGYCSILYSFYFDQFGLSPDIIPDSPDHIQAMYIASKVDAIMRLVGFKSDFADLYSGLSAYCEGDYDSAFSRCNNSVGDYSNPKVACNNIYLCLRSAEYLGKTDVIDPLVDAYLTYLAPMLYKELPTGSETDMEDYWTLYEKISRQINHLFLSGEGNASRYVDVFDNILAIKGFLTDQRMKLDRIVELSGSESLREDYAIMRQIQAEALQESDQGVIDTDQYRLAESSVMTKVRDLYGPLLQSPTTTGYLRCALAQGECAVEFYDAADVEGRGRDVEGSDLYALIVKYDDEQVYVIRLGECPDLDSKTDESCLMRLYQTFWAPLRQILAGTERVYFSLDRGLDSLPVEYALGCDGITASEEFGCCRLSSTRQVCQRSSSSLPDKAAVLYGGLDFDESDDSGRRKGAKRSGTRSSQDYLWGSLEEVDGISLQMDHLGKTYSKYVRTLGTEASFSALDGERVGVLHLATHGLCFDEASMAGDYANVRDVRLFDIIRSSKEENKDNLWRNALAMSGCNKTLTGQSPHADTSNDGILTAAEISRLDLSGIDLVVLSSCHSGYYGGADGYGLQRGFKMAGAHALIMTLWDVDDDAMQLLMSEFYARYLGGTDKRKALLEAQQVLRADSEYQAPEYWAGVILVDGY